LPNLYGLAEAFRRVSLPAIDNLINYCLIFPWNPPKPLFFGPSKPQDECPAFGFTVVERTVANPEEFRAP
jgi:hypothetical protein